MPRVPSNTSACSSPIVQLMLKAFVFCVSLNGWQAVTLPNQGWFKWKMGGKRVFRGGSPRSNRQHTARDKWP